MQMRGGSLRIQAHCWCSAGRHSLLDECRILMVHGVLHLLGHDHEAGDEESTEMASAESRILNALKWQVRACNCLNIASSELQLMSSYIH